MLKKKKNQNKQLRTYLKFETVSKRLEEPWKRKRVGKGVKRARNKRVNKQETTLNVYICARACFEQGIIFSIHELYRQVRDFIGVFAFSLGKFSSLERYRAND